MEPWDGDLAQVVIETPKDTANKLKFEPRLGAFRLGKVLPAGMTFPFDFGFLPGSRGGDGDPLDVLVLMDSPAFPGCVVPSRIVGVLQAQQTERDGTTERNDRVIAVADASMRHRDIRELSDVAPALLDEIEAFFVTYNRVEGKEFRVRRRSGSRRARQIADRAVRAARQAAKRISATPSIAAGP